MALVANINDAAGNGIECIILPHAAYVLPDGSHATANFDVAWCENCGGLCAIESLPTNESLAEWVAEASVNPMTAKIRFITNGNEQARERIIRKTRKQMEWLALRHTPAKCFHCNSLQCHEIVDDRDSFVHPLTGQNLTVAMVFGSTDIDSILYLLDVEGNRIGETERSFE